MMYHEKTDNFTNFEWQLHKDVVCYGAYLDSSMKVLEELKRIHQRMASHWKYHLNDPFRVKPRETLIWNGQDWIK